MTNHDLKHGAAANIAKLPELCYSVHETDPRQVIIIKAGEKGYYEAYRKATPEDARLTADRLNGQMDITKAQEKAMVAGSMFGWHIPAADPATWVGRV